MTCAPPLVHIITRDNETIDKKKWDGYVKVKFLFDWKYGMILHATRINSIQLKGNGMQIGCTKVIEYHIASHFHHLRLEKKTIKKIA